MASSVGAFALGSSALGIIVFYSTVAESQMATDIKVTLDQRMNCGEGPIEEPELNHDILSWLFRSDGHVEAYLKAWRGETALRRLVLFGQRIGDEVLLT